MNGTIAIRVSAISNKAVNAVIGAIFFSMLWALPGLC